MPHEDIGALWISRDQEGKPRKDKNGNIFMSGKINGQKVRVFKVAQKKDEKSPDFRIYPDKPREEQGTF